MASRISHFQSRSPPSSADGPQAASHASASPRRRLDPAATAFLHDDARHRPSLARLPQHPVSPYVTNPDSSLGSPAGSPSRHPGHPRRPHAGSAPHERGERRRDEVRERRVRSAYRRGPHDGSPTPPRRCAPPAGPDAADAEAEAPGLPSAVLAVSPPAPPLGRLGGSSPARRPSDRDAADDAVTRGRTRRRDRSPPPGAQRPIATTTITATDVQPRTPSPTSAPAPLPTSPAPTTPGAYASQAPTTSASQAPTTSPSPTATPASAGPRSGSLLARARSTARPAASVLKPAAATPAPPFSATAPPAGGRRWSWWGPTTSAPKTAVVSARQLHEQLCAVADAPHARPHGGGDAARGSSPPAAPAERRASTAEGASRGPLRVRVSHARLRSSTRGSTATSASPEGEGEDGEMGVIVEVEEEEQGGRRMRVEFGRGFIAV